VEGGQTFFLQNLTATNRKIVTDGFGRPLSHYVIMRNQVGMYGCLKNSGFGVSTMRKMGQPTYVGVGTESRSNANRVAQLYLDYFL
jgi:hypothetical protein